MRATLAAGVHVIAYGDGAGNDRSRAAAGAGRAAHATFENECAFNQHGSRDGRLLRVEHHVVGLHGRGFGLYVDRTRSDISTIAPAGNLAVSE